MLLCCEGACTSEPTSTTSLHRADSEVALSASDGAKCAHWRNFDNFLSIALETAVKRLAKINDEDEDGEDVSGR